MIGRMSLSISSVALKQFSIPDRVHELVDLALDSDTSEQSLAHLHLSLLHLIDSHVSSPQHLLHDSTLHRSHLLSCRPNTFKAGKS